MSTEGREKEMIETYVEPSSYSQHFNSFKDAIGNSSLQ